MPFKPGCTVPNHGKISKIWTLPLAIRNEVNRRLDDNHFTQDIANWLNSREEVRKIMAEKWKGIQVERQAVACWRRTGYKEWQKKRDNVEQLKELSEYALKLGQAACGSVADGSAAIIGGRIMSILENANDEDTLKMVRAVSELRSGDFTKARIRQTDEKLELERKRFQRDSTALFIKWHGNKKVRDIVESRKDNSEKIERLGRAMFGKGLAMLKPLPYELEVMPHGVAGRLYLQWRRQGHKTTTLARRALKFMLENPGGLVTFASASLLVGSELIMREGQVLESMRESARDRVSRDAKAIRAAFDSARKKINRRKKKFESNGDDLTPDDFAGLFEQQKLEARVWHSQTVCSRTRIIAPNPATARGWSGCVFVDEAGHIANLADLLEAMEPILSSDPEFRLILAGTPPNDEAHFSYELTLPPEGMTFSPNRKGHWYTSQAGMRVHRVDAWDAAAAGLKTYDPDTRKVVKPEQHRARALDRDAWDRNYGLVFKPGGTAALSLTLLQHAMAQGSGQCVFAEDDFAPGWRGLLGGGRIAIGFDPATTERKMSNPSALAVVEQAGSTFFVRLVFVFKTNDPAVSHAMLREALDLGHDAHGHARRALRVCIDATNERFFAAGLKQELAGRAICELVVSSEKTTHGGEEMSFKTWLGSLLVRQMEDGLLALPESRYIKDDFRLVTRDRGGFDNQVDQQGRHGDTFDAVKLALHGLLARGGPARAEAVPIGSATGATPRRTTWKNPFLRQIEGGGVKMNV